MQAPAPPMDARRQAMLKAMGIELWWTKPLPGAVRRADMPAPASNRIAPIATRSQQAPAVAIAQAPAVGAAPADADAVAVAAGARPQAPASWSSPAADAFAAHAPPSSQPAAHPPDTGTTLTPRVVAPPTVSLATAAVHFTPAAPLYADAAASSGEGLAAAGHCLLVVDDLSVLGQDEAVARQLLHNMVRAMGLAQSPHTWLSWACRSDSAADAHTASGPSAQDLLDRARPRAVLAMGRDAAQHLLGQQSQPLGVLRQSSHALAGVPVVVTYGPAYLLRAAHAKPNAWRDLLRVMQLLRG